MTTKTNPETFAAFFLSETSRVEIDLPNGEPMLYDGKQVAVNVYGPATDVFAKAKDAMDKGRRVTTRVAASLLGQGASRVSESSEAAGMTAKVTR